MFHIVDFMPFWHLEQDRPETCRACIGGKMQRPGKVNGPHRIIRDRITDENKSIKMFLSP
ncbi:hypothetical protein MCOR13_011800, partial [Pyricularia oryzae]